MKEPRNQMLSAKFSKEEFNLIKERASKEGLTLSGYVRKRLFRKDPIRNLEFEQRVLKLTSITAAHIQIITDQMGEEEFQKFKTIVNEIRRKYGIQEIE